MLQLILKETYTWVGKIFYTLWIKNINSLNMKLILWLYLSVFKIQRMLLIYLWLLDMDQLKLLDLLNKDISWAHFMIFQTVKLIFCLVYPLKILLFIIQVKMRLWSIKEVKPHTKICFIMLKLKEKLNQFYHYLMMMATFWFLLIKLNHTKSNLV